MEQAEPGIFERLRKEAKAGLLKEEAEKEVTIRFLTDRPITYSLQNYGWILFDELFHLLRIDVSIRNHCRDRKMTCDPVEVSKLLVYQRILEPGSKTKAVRHQPLLFGEWNIASNHMDRTLDLLPEAKEEILQTMHRRITQAIGRSGLLVFYDVTNYCVETDEENEDVMDENGVLITPGLRKRGSSKEHRPQPIIQMGLFMDQNRIPISYELFPGNQTGPITYLPSVERVKQQFGLERLVSVADKAMNSKKNVLAIYQKGEAGFFRKTPGYTRSSEGYTGIYPGAPRVAV